MKSILKYTLCSLTLFLFLTPFSMAQEEKEEEAAKRDRRPVRETFNSTHLIDQQTITIPKEKTREFNIQHRFGTIDKGGEDYFGIYAPTNIRLGMAYSITDRIMVGLGMTKNDRFLDLNFKGAILRQSRDGSIPVSVVYFGNVVRSGTNENNFMNSEEEFKPFNRMSSFHQIIIARRFNDWLSLQVAPSLSHYNIVDSSMKHDNFAVTLGGRVKVSPQTSVLFEYTHPFAQPTNEAFKSLPNLGMGIEVGTGSHAFQIFVSSFNGIINQKNMVYNYNDFTKRQILIGFNIIRLWGF
jgi:hypothetical protein